MAKSNMRKQFEKEAKEREFITNLEQILGFPLKSWQVDLILRTRRAHMGGQSYMVTREDVRKAKGS